MNTAEYVDQLVVTLKNEGIPLSDAAWETALACVDWAYVFGAWGEYCTPKNRKRRARDNKPTIVSKCQVLNGKKSSCDGCKWYPEGKNTRMFDCRGFTDWVLKQFGIDLTGEGATSQWNTASNWETKGTIDTIPDDVLVCLFVYNAGTKKMEHTGLGYKGASCECSSGVQYFAKRKAKWTHWAMPKGIGGSVPVPTPTPEPTPGTTKPTLRKGDKGPYVTELQNDLVSLGYDLGTFGPEKNGVDGSFGAKTETAVKEFQRTHTDANGNPLKVDGVVGQSTWWALDNAVAPQPDPGPEPEIKLYTVIIPDVSKETADALKAQYPEATIIEGQG